MPVPSSLRIQLCICHLVSGKQFHWSHLPLLALTIFMIPFLHKSLSLEGRGEMKTSNLGLRFLSRLFLNCFKNWIIVHDSQKKHKLNIDLYKINDVCKYSVHVTLLNFRLFKMFPFSTLEVYMLLSCLWCEKYHTCWKCNPRSGVKWRVK